MPFDTIYLQVVPNLTNGNLFYLFYIFSFSFLRVFITQVPRPPPNRQKVLYVNSCKSKVLFLDAKQLSIAETGLLNNLPLDLKSHTTSEMLMTVAVYFSYIHFSVFVSAVYQQ